MMNKHKLWIGSLSAAVLLGGSAVAASGNMNGQPAPQIQSETTQSAPASVTQSTSANQNNTGKLLTVSQAKSIALKAVEGKVDDVDLERRNGQTFYEVEIDRKGKPDVTVRLDAYTGKVLAVVNDDDYDDDDDYRDNGTGNSSSASASNQVKLTVAQASNIALKQVTGGKVTKVELDRDNGRYVYEIELRTAQGEADVDIDANTGKVLSFDQDFDDED
ncbi:MULTISPECIES: PepSY domain-containing protein [Paenibacillus]|uniref:PepSY domain-containing protein n=2 Tax=Paenibacillus TaxID=44249 RepID=A0ABS7KDU3_9BACL|nr:PepSY domain-containing protein [Paenibacillus cucumis (ex Kampfer et al. 2016)]MBY0202136.1 PepSY domain-containing protein [Paenibacillus cucumis (ex Kampfer et al. 2016)]MDP9700181.1 putative membrane protein YkoI [Paenibacillus intestini]